MATKPLISNIIAYAASNFTAAAIICITQYTNSWDKGTLASAEFVIVPMLMGIISMWVWRKQDLNTADVVRRSSINALFGVIMSFLFLGEGAICLLIVSPLLLLFVVTGAFLGRAMFKRNNQHINVSIISLLLIFLVIDSTSKHVYKNMVTDEVIINAPASKVWQYVVAYPRNTSPDKYWLFKIGMPSPVQSTAEGYYKGANRKCIFSNGYVFDEKIVQYDKDVKLTFDVTHQPRDPEIMGHIDLLRGQFILKDNGNNTTTLTGNSWYRLYVFPTWYYNLWAESVVRNVHLRVMGHIKYLSEAH